MTTIQADRATCENVGIKVVAKDGADAEAIALAASRNATIGKYLADFAAPIRDGDGGVLGKASCFKCGAKLDGLLGTFTWDICHGEGFCGKCLWPGRALHYIKDADGKKLFDRPLRFILQYHPENVTDAKEDDDE